MPALLYCVTQTEPAVSPARGVCEAAVESSAILGVRVYWSTVDDVEACLGAPDAMKGRRFSFIRCCAKFCHYHAHPISLSDAARY